MKLLDVNVVLAGHRDVHPDFGIVAPWLERLVDSGTPFSVPDLVAGSVVRLATNRRLFTPATPIGAVFEYLRGLRSAPGHVVTGPGPGHLDVLERVCVDADATGDLVPDAQLVALATEHAAEIVSFDRDLARFDVRWSRPGD